MAAVLVRLKLTLLRRAFSREPAALVGFLIGLCVAVFFTGIAAVALIGAHSMSAEDARSAVVPALSLLTLGWILMPLLMFGSDATLDPARFALLPVPARKLQPGLTLAGLLGIPGVALVVLSLAQIVTWSRGLGTLLLGCAAALLGTLTSFLFSRVVTTAFSQALSSRKMRDVAAVILGIFAACAGISNQVIMTMVNSSHGSASRFHTASDIVGWTPLGWAWSAPADAATHRMAAAGVKTVLSVALVGVLWWAWGRFLARALETTLSEGDSGEVHSGSFITRLSGNTPTGAILGRCLRYWRRDPRYLSALVTLLVVPVVMCFSWHTKGDAMFIAPTFIAGMAAVTLLSDLAYDNSAFWWHISTGVPMRADRWGRLSAMAVIVVPLIAVAEIVIAFITGHWAPIVWSLALALAAAGIGGGVAAAIGAYVPGQAPAPGAGAFGKGTGGGMRVFFAVFGSWFAIAALMSPVIVLVVLHLAWIALAVGLVLAAVCVTLGVRIGAARMERTLPELLGQISH